MNATSIKVRNPIPLYSLFTAHTISLLGNVFSMIAVPWFVLQTTGSAAQTGISGFFTMLPVVLAGFFASIAVHEEQGRSYLNNLKPAASHKL